MKLLLDTHCLLWWLDDPKLLSKEARQAIGDASNFVFISAAVAWEIVIKKSLGKIDLPNNLEDMLNDSKFDLLPITVAHTLTVQALPGHHRDPFDRILVAQAICEGLTIVTRDPSIRKYTVSCMVA